MARRFERETSGQPTRSLAVYEISSRLLDKLRPISHTTFQFLLLFAQFDRAGDCQLFWQHNRVILAGSRLHPNTSLTTQIAFLRSWNLNIGVFQPHSIQIDVKPVKDEGLQSACKKVGPWNLKARNLQATKWCDLRIHWYTCLSAF